MAALVMEEIMCWDTGHIMYLDQAVIVAFNGINKKSAREAADH